MPHEVGRCLPTRPPVGTLKVAAPEFSGVSKHPKDRPFSSPLFPPCTGGRPTPHPHPNPAFAELREDSGSSRPVSTRNEMQTESKPQAQRTGACWRLAGSRTACLTPA